MSFVFLREKEEKKEKLFICENTRLVYDRNRYDPDNSPLMIYVPSREMLFKMMKACIDVDSIYELWIYDDEEKGTTPLASEIYDDDQHQIA